MKIKYDFDIDLATAPSRLSKKWKNRKWRWSDLVTACAEPTVTNETVAEYLHMSREEQSNVKDVGGFVGGYLNEGLRKTDNVAWRSVATLDIDYGTADAWDDFTTQFGCAALMYSTHKHTAEKPRYRLVVPLSRQVTPEEYEPLCRKIASAVGIEMFDVTTYQLARLFYWPSRSKDGEWFFEVQDGRPCDVDALLSEYHNYRDTSEWTMSSREGELVRHEIRKAGDPTEKNGLIGAFCRAYGIEEAIGAFLSDVYEKTAHEGRYTYKSGSVAGGLVIYDGKFAYSNHETDPASRKLCNAFDLVRIHLYGDLDEGKRTEDVTKLPSYQRMQEFVQKDGKVCRLLLKERRASAVSDFGNLPASEDGAEDTGATDDGWVASLDVDKRGTVKPTACNIMTILENDRGLKGKLWHDDFSGFDLVNGGLPWDKRATIWRNTDESNLRVYLDNNYGVQGKDKIKDATVAVLTRHRRHPIREYLNGLEWDGVERLDRLIIDYIGAEDNELNRVMTRKHFTAAVARVMRPGCKYDYCLIITGAEGIGKSTLFSVMGGEWFSDSLVTMEGKQGMEQARGGWVIELPELGSIKRSDVEQVKAFISRQDDTYRPAYGTVVERHPRQCVFCGTTNETYFLKGDTGNRRFWVMQVNADLCKFSDPCKALADDRDQLWAEAVQRWKDGEKLYLPAELEREARQRQKDFNDNSGDPMEGMVRRFLDMRLPIDWQTYDLNRRRAWYRNPDPLDAEGTEQRTRVCAAEFICEMLGRDMSDKEYKYLARKVCGYIREVDGWKEGNWSRSCEKLYGRQRGFVRMDGGNEVLATELV